MYSSKSSPPSNSFASTGILADELNLLADAFDDLNHMPWYSKVFYATIVLTVVYYLYRIYRWLKPAYKQEAAQKSEIENLNEIYRGLNSEECEL